METLYKIIYTNYFLVKNRRFSFRKKLLFDTTETPFYLELKDNNGSKGYWINRKWFSLSKIQNMIVNESVEIDISKLQWYMQEDLIHCFNL